MVLTMCGITAALYAALTLEKASRLPPGWRMDTNIASLACLANSAITGYCLKNTPLPQNLTQYQGTFDAVANAMIILGCVVLCIDFIDRSIFIVKAKQHGSVENYARSYIAMIKRKRPNDWKAFALKHSMERIKRSPAQYEYASRIREEVSPKQTAKNNMGKANPLFFSALNTSK